MSRSNLLIGGERRLASEERSRADGSDAFDEHYQHFIPTAIGAVPTLLSAYLGGASPNMNVNGAVTEVEFDLAPASDAVYRIDRLTLVLACSGSILMSSLGDLAALADGIELAWLDEDEAVLVDILGGQTIKSLNDLAAGWALDIRELGASHTVQATLALPTPIRLDGAATEILRATVSDDLSTLARLRIHALGVIEEMT